MVPGSRKQAARKYQSVVVFMKSILYQLNTRCRGDEEKLKVAVVSVWDRAICMVMA